MSKKSKKSNKCSVCDDRGSKGWFSLPNENEETHRQWRQVIDGPITELSRVCYKHFRYEDLGLTRRGYAKIEPGKTIFVDQVQYLSEITAENFGGNWLWPVAPRP